MTGTGATTPVPASARPASPETHAPPRPPPAPLAAGNPRAGGSKQRPTYLQVSGGGTGHAESVQVMYDPAVCSFDTLLDVYWHQARTPAGGQARWG